eukprot:scaffold275178_cov18-Tisochrysis_lutea.AAC.2
MQKSNLHDRVVPWTREHCRFLYREAKGLEHTHSFKQGRRVAMVWNIVCEPSSIMEHVLKAKPTHEAKDTMRSEMLLLVALAEDIAAQ